MDTLLLRGDNPEDIERAGDILRRGGLVAIPTETVYGLAANALDGGAVKRVYEAKGRPSDNPLIVHIAHLSQLAPLVQEVPESAGKLADAFWPGPLTMILPKSPRIPREVSGGLSTVAVRFPAHPVAQAVIRAAGMPLAAPSANLSGKPSPTSFAHVKEDLLGRVDALLDGGDCGVGVESTVITLAEGTPRVLRPGGITLSALRRVLGRVEVDPAVLHGLSEKEAPRSPGMKYKHYSPSAEVVLVDASPEKYAGYVNEKGDGYALCFDEDVVSVPSVSYGGRYCGEEQAHRLFWALHRLDELGAKKAYAHMPSKRGVGLAVYNRLIRAAGFQVVRPEKSLVVGLTGPSGAGKSTVGALLSQAGCRVLDCDALTRSPQVYDEDCIRAIQNAFGADTASNGVLDRALLGSRAFSSPEAKAKLEAIVFPRIVARVREFLDMAQREGERCVVLDAPTLFEAGLDVVCGRILTVTAPRELRLSRIRRRDRLTKQAALRRISAQHPEEYYLSRADHVVENGGEGSLEDALAPILLDWKEALKEGV